MRLRPSRPLDPWLAIGVALLFLLLVVAAFGDRIAPFDPGYSVVRGPAGELRPLAPGAPFALGSDLAGRDLGSVVLHGARTTLSVAVTAGLARLLLGLALAVLAIRLRPVRPLLDGIADLVSAVPSTLVAVVIVLALAGTGVDLAVVVGALLATGWSGPYRIARSELSRLRQAPFSEGARALGVGPLALVARHHVPHLVPVLAASASQQVTASLVALAELGVLAVFASPTRTLDFSESGGGTAMVPITDRPEWGALLAMARSVQDLYLTRWTFLVPGIAMALAAVAFAITGVGISRQYRRRNLLQEARSPIAGVLLVLFVITAITPAFLPPRHAMANAWAAQAQAAARTPFGISAELLRGAGLEPVGSESYVVERTSEAIRPAAPAAITIRTSAGDHDLREGWGPSQDFVPVLFRGSGGATVDASVVFAGWGISPGDFPPRPPTGPFSATDFGTEVKDWADDYSGLDVRGKIVLILKLPSLQPGPNRALVPGPDLQTSVANATKRGAAAVLFVEPGRVAAESSRARGTQNPYRRLVELDPVDRIQGVPAVIVDLRVADELLAPAGLSASKLLAELVTAVDPRGAITRASGPRTNDVRFGRSFARPLPATARVSLTLAMTMLTSRSWLAATPAAPHDERALVVWGTTRSLLDGDPGGSAALLTVLAALRGRELPPLILVLFDPGADPIPDARAIVSRFAGRRIDLVVGLDTLRGDRLRFITQRGEIQLFVDEFARDAGLPFQRTVTSKSVDDLGWVTGLEALVRQRTLLVLGIGDPRSDVVADGAAFLAYLLGRYAERAPELAR